MMGHTIYDAAKWFTDRNGGAIGSKKLQKMCYYAQAWSYALYDKPLFKGKFRAWVHGPVNKKLWNTFKDISYRDITSEDFDDLEIEITPFSKKKQAFLERVWATYGHFTGHQLEILTHREKPWLEQREGVHQYENSSNVIDAETMAQYYRDIYIGNENT